MKRLPLWPSHASRWVNCSGSPRVTQAALSLPQGPRPFADEGTLAHAVFAGTLTGKAPIGYLDGELKKEHQKIDWKAWLPEEDIDIVITAADEVRFLADLGGYAMAIEVFLPVYFPEHQMNAKIDVLLHNKTDVAIIDYKHGSGVKVHVDGNAQMELYAIAARKAYPDHLVSVGILQPRGVGDGFKLKQLDTRFLDDLEKTYAAGVRRAYAPEPVYVKGPWCQWCEGYNGLCPRLLEDAVNALGVIYIPDPPWDVLRIADDVSKWLKGLKDTAFTRLSSGQRVPGWALEDHPSRRRWRDPEEVAPVLASLLGGDADDYNKVTTKPIGITDATRLAKKHKINISDFIETPTRRVLTYVGEDADTDTGFGSVE